MPARLYQWARTTGKIWAEIVRGRRNSRALPERVRGLEARGPGGPLRASRHAKRKRPPGCPAASSTVAKPVLDRSSDVAEDLRDLAAQEDEGNDRDDRDEGEDEGVLGEALPLLVARHERRDENIETSHGGVTSFPSRVSRPAGAGGPEPVGSQ